MFTKQTDKNTSKYKVFGALVLTMCIGAVCFFGLSGKSNFEFSSENESTNLFLDKDTGMVMQYLLKKAAFWSSTMSGDKKQDSDLSVEKKVAKYGYQTKQHRVVTEDGYILFMHQIFNDKINKNSPVVLCMHGIASDENSFTANKANSLAYLLVDQGFNVYLGNNRGNKYSRSHIKLNANVDTKQYFDYSFFELGQYDVPAMVDYILQKTHKKQIGYIGHSQGTSQMFSALALNHGNLNSKISAFAALAPVASFRYQESSNTQGSKEGLKKLLDTSKKWCDKNDFYEIGPSIGGLGNIIGILAKPILKEKADVLKKSISVKQILHYGQIEESGRFQEFDYGYTENQNWYGMPKPPQIPLSAIKVPVGMWVGAEDKIANPKDSNYVRKQIGNNVEEFHVIPGYHHDSFTRNDDMKYFPKLSKFLKKHVK